MKSGKPAPEPRKPGSASMAERAPRYDAVEVIPDPNGCCMAVRQLAGKRILATKVPLLPLKNCDRATCACAYRRFKDRRANARRVADMDLTVFDEALPSDKDRRDPDTGRRKSDKRST